MLKSDIEVEETSELVDNILVCHAKREVGKPRRIPRLRAPTKEAAFALDDSGGPR
jgi:hypothetical protein